MKILVFSWRDHKHPQAGGAEQVMYEHIKGWLTGGHKVTLFSSRFMGCKEYEELGNMKMIHRGDQYLGVKIDAFFYWLKNRRKFDLVVDQFHGIPFFTPLYIRKPKLAVLQELAKEVWFLNGFPFPLNYIIGTIGFLGEPFIFPFYKRVPFMVGSGSAKRDLVGVGVSYKNITIVPHGVIIKRTKANVVKEEVKTIAFLGALTKDKGVEDAIKAFSVLSRFGDYKFWIIGKGGKKYTSYLWGLCNKYGIKNKTKFWGFVNDSKKFELLARAHVLVNPSVREGWGLVNIEANAVGTPVVAYKSAGLVDSVKNGLSGVLCRKNTPEVLAENILFILSKKNLYQRLVRGAIKWSEGFSWEKSRKLSLELINRISKP